MYKLVYSISVALLTLVIGYLCLSKITEQSRGRRVVGAESFACGIFLGAGLLHMLGEASALFLEQGIHYPIAPLIMGSVFLGFLLMEHIGQEYYSHRASDLYFALLALIMLSIHSFLEGSAVGLSQDIGVATVLFVAVLSHKAAASFAIATQLIKSPLSRLLKWVCYVCYALMTPMGILIGSSVADGNYMDDALSVPIFLALAAGTFLYLGTLHGLEKGVLVKQCCNLRQFCFVILGFVVMAVMALYI